MTPAKLWLTVFLAGFAFIVALLVVTLTTPIPYGDLTRIGLLSESEFGWRIAQPSVDPKYLTESPIDESDILVIGDSFSMTNRWQSVLTEAGYQISTSFWGNIDETLCADFDAWLDRAGFRGRLVIIESVERRLVERLDKMRECTRMKKPLESKPEPFFTYPERVPGFKLNWKAKLTSGYVTYQNTRKAKEATRDKLFEKHTWVRAVEDGCDLFSHRLCEKALFYRDDDKSELTGADVARMRSFNAEHPTRTILWMIVPNKTTVYVQPDHSKDFVAALPASGLGPELFSFAQAQKTSMRDFYFPNDTHLSDRGQLTMGGRMLKAVVDLLPVPENHARAPEGPRLPAKPADASPDVETGDVESASPRPDQ